MMRLDRWLVTIGIGSRTQVQKLIRQGQVTVNAVRVTDPSHACGLSEALTVSGRSVDGRLTRHLMLNKPAGLLTAARDSRQPTVMNLLPPWCQSLGCMPVGRLDKDTKGLLLLTTDGELSHRLLSPARHVDKVYLAVVEGSLTQADAAAFAAGLDLGDFIAAPALLELLAPSTARVTVHEGKFHQVKRMFEAVGHPVAQLHRERFGPLSLEDELEEGRWRELSEEETKALYAAAGMGER